MTPNDPPGESAATTVPRLTRLRAAADPFWTYFERSFARPLPPGAADLRYGNPMETAPADYVDALLRWTPPHTVSWFAYQTSLPHACEHVADLCRSELGVPVDPADVHLTRGVFGGLPLMLWALLEPGDEVVVLDPPWFFYDLQIEAAGGRCVHVRLEPPDFSPDPQRLADALTLRTRAVIVNTPHNPTGRIYTDAELSALADVLRDASSRNGQPIVLLSDDSYRRIVYDGQPVPNPARFYSDTVLMHTYGKTTLAPGERIGWLAVPTGCASRDALRACIPLLQVAHGWAWPDAVLQRALPDLELVRIDLSAMQRRRDHLVGAMTASGYDVTPPQGTFYVFARCPDPDDEVFCNRLADEHHTFVLPGTIFRAPGWFRLSLTASDSMVTKAAAALAALRPAQAGHPPEPNAPGGRPAPMSGHGGLDANPLPAPAADGDAGAVPAPAADGDAGAVPAPAAGGDAGAAKEAADERRRTAGP